MAGEGDDDARATLARVFYAGAAAIVLLLTLTPQIALAIDGSTLGRCSWDLGWGYVPRERVANVLLFIPLGLACALLPRRRLALAAAVALPFLIEALQALLPLGRICDVTDLAANLVGLTVGLLMGLGLLGLGRVLPR